MSGRLLLLVVVLSTGFQSVAAQGIAQLRPVQRADRVVLSSPHFDVPVPQWGGLSCPAGPLHLYGFESEVEDPSPSLQVRVFLYDPSGIREYVVADERSDASPLRPAKAVVRLTHLVGPAGEEELAQGAPWGQLADDAGLAVLAVPPGIYRIRLDYLGTHNAEGIIQVREARSDSLWAFLIPGAICNE